MNAEEARADIEAKAEEAKQRLLDKVDLLEQRKEVAVDRLRRVRACVLPLTVATVLCVWLVRHRRKRPHWPLPWRASKRPALTAHLGEEILISGVTMLATRLLERAIDGVLPSTTLGAQAPLLPPYTGMHPSAYEDAPS